MAEDRYPLAEALRAGMARWQIGAEAQIAAWQARWDHTFKSEADTWRGIGYEWREVDSRDRGPILTVVPKDPERLLQDQHEAVAGLQRTREWLAANPIEEIQERLQRSAEAARDALQQARLEVDPLDPAQPVDVDPGDPEYLGGQAEQRFYDEHDPDSEWYREDVYHGEPGPEVTQGRQEWAAWANERDQGLSVPNIYDTERLDGQVNGMLSGVHPLEIDASDPDLGASWQVQLDDLDARIAALTESEPPVGWDRDRGLEF